jgi:hypothetical protein
MYGSLHRVLERTIQVWIKFKREHLPARPKCSYFLHHGAVATTPVSESTQHSLSGPSEWRYVHSPRDAIIVDVAGALKFLSGGYLRSTVHRVVRPPEDQAAEPRLSLIYLARPQADVKLRSMESPLLKRLGLQREGENRDVDGVTAECEYIPILVINFVTYNTVTLY